MSDHELKVGTDDAKRFDILRGKDDVPMYEVTEDDRPYQNPLLFTQDNWLGGHGQFHFREPDVYFEGQSIDTTQDGRVFLGPLIYSVDAKNLVDAAVADDGTVLTTETSEAIESTANDMTLLPSTPAVNDAYYFGSAATFTQIDLNIGTKGAGVWTVTWEYYNGSSWTALSGVTDNTTGFTAGTGVKTVTFTLPGDWATVTVNSIADTYWIRGRVSAYTSVTTQPKGTQCWVYKTDLDLGANPVGFCWFNAISKLMVHTAEKVYEYDGTYYLERIDFGSSETITDVKEYEDILYVALNSATKYYCSSDGKAYTQTDLTDGYADKIFVAPNPAGTQDVIWKSKLPNEVSQTTNGQASGTQWSTANYVGDKSNNVTNIFLVGDVLMVGREDNLFWLDEDGGIHPLMSDLRHNRSATNFKYVDMWSSGAYFSLDNDIGEILQRFSFRTVGPLKDTADVGKTGTCIGIAADKDFLYIGMDEGTNNIIYKGREIRRPIGLRWEWCPWVFLSTTACATMKVCQHTATDRRLWFGYGNNAGYVILTDDPTADSAARFAAAGWIRMSYIYGTNPYWDKMWQSVVTQTEGCTANLTVTPQYRKNAETSATALTAAITTNGTVKTNLTTALSSKRIQFELHLATNASANTPEVSFFQVRGVEKPETVRVHDVVYYAGSEPSELAKTIRDYFRDGRTSTSLIKFADLRFQGPVPTGTASTDYVWVVMQPGYPKEPELFSERGREPELGIRCRFQEISFTIS